MFNVIQGIVIRMSNILYACFNPKTLILESHIQQKYMEPKPQYQNFSSFKSFFWLTKQFIERLIFIQKISFLTNNDNGESSINVGKSLDLSDHYLPKGKY